MLELHFVYLGWIAPLEVSQQLPDEHAFLVLHEAEVLLLVAHACEVAQVWYLLHGV